MFPALLGQSIISSTGGARGRWPNCSSHAIELAEDGFPIGQYLATQIAAQRPVFQPETRAIFLNADGSVPAQGSTLRQPDLARAFRLLARDGAAAFYEGEISTAIVEAQRRAAVPGREGKMTLADLSGYAIDVREPLSLAYEGYDVHAPRPGGSSGGVVLLESLGLMREFLADPRNAGYPWGFATRNSLHVFIEAMRLAFADRDFWVGTTGIRTFRRRACSIRSTCARAAR